VSRDDRKNSNSGACLRNARPWRAAVLALAITALLAAACGGGGASGSSSDQNTTAQLNAFASCMRSHGLPNFYFTRQTGTPSPPPAGDDSIMGIGQYFAYFNRSSPAYEAATKACQHMSPFGSAPPGPSHLQFLEELKRANCMRSHGYPNYPDPNPTIRGQTMVVGGVANSPQFKAAAKTCGEPV
jgi:hypothetical protein